PLTAASRSASSKTINGALPPSSSDTFFTVDAHCAINCLPIAVEPVKENFRTSGLEVSSLPMGPDFDEVMMVSTPCGIPARAAGAAKANADRGVADDGFRTAGHPAARAGATFRLITALGKSQGVTAATTPTGSFIPMMRRPAALVGITSP